MSVTFPTNQAVDFLVLGAGAAGGVVAKELSTAGFSVVVLEQGPYLHEEDFTHDEIKYTIQHAITNDTKIQPITYRKSEREQGWWAAAASTSPRITGDSTRAIFTSAACSAR